MISEDLKRKYEELSSSTNGAFPVILVTLCVFIGSILYNSFRSSFTSMSHDEIQGMIFLILLFCGGGFAFFHGFTQLKKKRLIQNIPTATVRSLAMGMNELVGEAKEYITMYSPLTNTPCCYYEYMIEKLKGFGKNRSWNVITAGSSKEIPFILKDSTGSVLILPEGSEIISGEEKYSYKTGLGKPIPSHISLFMDTLDIRHKGFWHGGKFRFTEFYIVSGKTIYVLGDAQKSKRLLEEYASDLRYKKSELINHSHHKKEFDLNNDGEISNEEWEIAKRNIEKKMLESLKENNNSGDVLDIAIGKSYDGNPFIISDYSQKGLVNKLSGTLFWNIYGGAIISVLSLAFLVFILIK